MNHFHRLRVAAALTLLAAGLTGTPAARGQTAAPVPAATIITSAPYTITAAGFYQLGANLTYAGNGSPNDAIITINAPNVTLDLGGHYISGPSDNPATELLGVYASGVGNLTIQNGTISHCFYGVYLYGDYSSTPKNFNQTIRNVLVTHCYYGGIDLVSPSSSQVNDCEVSFIGGTTVSGDAGFATGIYFTGNVGAGCQITNNTVTSITAGSQTGYGIFAVNGTIVDNTVDGVSGSQAAYGIYHGELQAGNQVLNCSVGIDTAGKYQNNLTYNCTTPFTGGGTDAGGNN